MKVAMIGLRGLDDGLGGVEKAVREITTRLVKRGVEVTCYCRAGYSSETSYKGVKLKNIKTVNTKHGETMFYALKAICHAIKEDYDIIHIHALASSTLAWLIKIFSNKRIIITIHGLDWQRAKWGRIAKLILKMGETIAVRNANSIICVSLSLQIYFRMRYPGIKFSMIPNGCDNIKKTVLQPPNGLAKKKYILYMGRIVPEKGIHKLILAYKKISTDYPLIIAGPDQHASDYVKYLKSITDDHPKIHFVGSLSGEVKEQYLANSYLFVLPSEIEGLPIALLEAASYAVCPLVSNIPTAVEVLGTKELARGYVCDTGSIKELQTVLELALENEALSNQLGKVVQLHVEKHFNWDRITTQTFSVYKQCLGQ